MLYSILNQAEASNAHSLLFHFTQQSIPQHIPIALPIILHVIIVLFVENVVLISSVLLSVILCHPFELIVPFDIAYYSKPSQKVLILKTLRLP